MNKKDFRYSNPFTYADAFLNVSWDQKRRLYRIASDSFSNWDLNLNLAKLCNRFPFLTLQTSRLIVT